MSKLIKIILCAVGVWIMSLALIILLSVPESVMIVQGVSVLVGLSLLTVGVVSLFIDKDKISSALAILLISVTAWLALTKSPEWAARFHFLKNREKYEAKVAEILSASSKKDREKLCRHDECSVLSEYPVRVSFPYSGGFFNAQIFAYDPTGEPIEMDENKTVKTYYYRRKAKHLSGNWYWIYFGG
jgi:hypothetical protein